MGYLKHDTIGQDYESSALKWPTAIYPDRRKIANSHYPLISVLHTKGTYLFKDGA